MLNEMIIYTSFMYKWARKKWQTNSLSSRRGVALFRPTRLERREMLNFPDYIETFVNEYHINLILIYMIQN